MKLILTRHGQTEENKKRITQGWLPGKLSELGKKQARLLANRLKDVHIDVIYSSDLARAYDTAMEIAKHHDCKLIKEERIRELHHGQWQGKVTKKEDYANWKQKRIHARVNGAESYSDALLRAKDFLEFLLKKYDDKTVLVVCHGGIGMFLKGALMKKNVHEALELPVQGNTAISEFEIDKKGNYKILHWNCQKHLSE